MDKLNQRQELFAQYIFSGMIQRDAYIKAYNPQSSIEDVDSAASRLTRNVKVSDRIDELNRLAVGRCVLTVEERKEILSEIARTKVSDFISAGPDGAWVNIGIDGCQSSALRSVSSKTEYDEDGSHPTVVTDIRLHDPIKAINLLNKMDKLYDDSPTVNIDNRKIEIYVNNQETHKLLTEIAEGIPPHADDNNEGVRGESSGIPKGQEKGAQ